MLVVYSYFEKVNPRIFAMLPCAFSWLDVKTYSLYLQELVFEKYHSQAFPHVLEMQKFATHLYFLNDQQYTFLFDAGEYQNNGEI